MHAGTPVIASAAVGAVAGGLVVHGATGMVTRAGDVKELASAIATLLGDAELRDRLSRLGREQIADYSYEAAADAFGTALESVGALR